MEIISISSGSKGNCYYISDGLTSILLDCGVPIKKIKQALWEKGKRLSSVDACLVTHHHGDHASSMRQIKEAGINIYASSATIENIGISGYRIHAIKEPYTDHAFLIGKTFHVMALEVEHDAPGTLSFICSSDHTKKKLLYVTDTKYFKYLAHDLSHIMIETNYDPKSIEQNVADHWFSADHAKRVIKTHMSIDIALLTVEKLKESALKEVWLIHLSSENSAPDFKRRMQEVAGVPVYIAT